MTNKADYRDTYFGQVVDVSDPDRPEIVEHVNVRAVDYSDARRIVLENTDVPEDHELRIKRYRPSYLVESVLDKYRRWRRQYGSKGKSKAPQYNRR